MKKVDTIIKEKNHFIGSWYIDEKPLDELIDYFNSSHVKHTPGKLEQLLSKCPVYEVTLRADGRTFVVLECPQGVEAKGVSN